MSMHRILMRSSLALTCSAVTLIGAAGAQAVTLDFETEDDFLTTLVNGQSISSTARADRDGVPFSTDTVLEFGNLVNITATVDGSDGHLDISIFDSDPAGPNAGSQDPDLLVDKGNILILQSDNPASATTTSVSPTHGLVFDNPNDEANNDDRGSIVFDFLAPVELTSIDMVDINGGAHATLTLTDTTGDVRIYDVPSQWTTDVTVATMGWQTLLLNTLAAQPSEPSASGGDATVIQNDAGFDPTSVVQLNVAFDGSPSSAAIDNLVFIPEPASLALLGLGALAMFRRR